MSTPQTTEQPAGQFTRMARVARRLLPHVLLVLVIALIVLNVLAAFDVSCNVTLIRSLNTDRQGAMLNCAAWLP